MSRLANGILSALWYLTRHRLTRTDAVIAFASSRSLATPLTRSPSTVINSVLSKWMARPTSQFSSITWIYSLHSDTHLWFVSGSLTRRNDLMSLCQNADGCRSTCGQLLDPSQPVGWYYWFCRRHQFRHSALRWCPCCRTCHGTTGFCCPSC